MVSLRGTDSHLYYDRIRLQLEAGLDEDLQQAARDSKTHEEKSLHPWIAKIKDLDNQRIIQRKRIAEAVEEAMKSNKKPFTSSSCYANTADAKTPTTSSSSTTSTRDYPPKLTDEERRLLMEYLGCLKCRKFFAGHHAHQCTTTISGKGYKPLTEKDALRAKAAHNANSPPRTLPLSLLYQRPALQILIKAMTSARPFFHLSRRVSLAMEISLMALILASLL